MGIWYNPAATVAPVTQAVTHPTTNDGEEVFFGGLQKLNDISVSII